MKTFLGISLPADINQQILDLMNSVKHLAPRANWQKCPHITLAFLGEKEVPHNLLEQVCLKYSPFEVSTNGFGSFKRGVAWLAIDKGFSKVHKLGSELYEELGVRGTFSSHLTLYKEGPVIPLELKQKLVRTAYGPWTVDHVTLFESKGGGSYEPIKEYPLHA